MSRKSRHSIFIGCEGTDEVEIFGEIHLLKRDKYNIVIRTYNANGGGPLPVISSSIRNSDSASYDKKFCVLDLDRAEDENVVEKVESLAKDADIEIVWAKKNLEDEINKGVLGGSSSRMSKSELATILGASGSTKQVRAKMLSKIQKSCDDSTIERSLYFKKILNYIHSQDEL